MEEQAIVEGDYHLYEPYTLHLLNNNKYINEKVVIIPHEMAPPPNTPNTMNINHIAAYPSQTLRWVISLKTKKIILAKTRFFTLLKQERMNETEVHSLLKQTNRCRFAKSAASVLT